MKVSIDKVRVAPKHISKEFCFSFFYGDYDEEVSSWILDNPFDIHQSGPYVNLFLNDNASLNDVFYDTKVFRWMDGFSPNLNKRLHVGHFSNLVLAKAFRSLGVCEKTVSIYGDTLSGSVSNDDGMSFLRKYQDDFGYHPDREFLASKMFCKEEMLIAGTGDYEGTKVFDLGVEKVVGIKSDGSSSYFYQDVAMAAELSASTLYLTGKEQSNHFDLLSKMFDVDHIGLGLVKIGGKKMSSRKGNVVLIDEFISSVDSCFGDDIELKYNVFAGFILRSSPSSDKNINLDFISNPSNSPGLYLSYTMARLRSAGCDFLEKEEFSSRYLSFAEMKSLSMLQPNVLFRELIDHCKEINALYGSHRIKGSKENKDMFDILFSDLVLGAKKLGLFFIEKV